LDAAGLEIVMESWPGSALEPGKSGADSSKKSGLAKPDLTGILCALFLEAKL
jgi:hypothetical protein